MKKSHTGRRGFTLFEIIVTIAIIVLVGTISVVSLYSNRGRQVLDTTTRQIGNLLREAQADSLAQKQGSIWGVHFDNTTATLQFYDFYYSPNGTYASGTIAGHYALPNGLCFATSSIPIGSTLDVTFSNVSGGASTSTTVSLQLMGTGSGGCPSTTSTVQGGVTRNTSGLIFFDDFGRSNL